MRDSSIHKIRELVDKSGAVELLQRRREELIAQAQDNLANSVLSADQRTRFRDLFDFIRQLIQGTAN